MKLDEIDRQPCSIARAMAQIGDTWSLLILREAFYGRTRFTDFTKYTGAQKTVVSDRLKRLVASGILERATYSEHPTRCGYELTAKGRDLAPVLLTLGKWGDTWADNGAGAPITVTHNCGHPADPSLVCGSCGQHLDVSDITPGLGPGYPKNRSDIFAE